jgi:hypothetical protein
VRQAANGTKQLQAQEELTTGVQRANYRRSDYAQRVDYCATSPAGEKASKISKLQVSNPNTTGLSPENDQ